MSTNEKKKKKKKKLTAGIIIGRIFAVLGITIAMIVVFLLMVIFVMVKGPSKEACKLFTLSAYETSAIKWVPRIFLSNEEYESILHPSVIQDDFKEFAKLASDSGSGKDNASGMLVPVKEDIEVIDIMGATYQGKVMLVHDSSKVQFASIDSFGGVGLTLSSFNEKYGAVACTNAGGFVDENGQGKGGIPEGIVLKDGNIVYGSTGGSYPGFAGFDKDNKLHVGTMTGQDALNLGIVNGTNFQNGPTLIKDGVRTESFNGGINPRTAIGQSKDGTVILVAIEGRLADSLGATFDDLADIMEEYGAINAANMDGGSSSGMYYKGERITRSCSIIGDRPLPTAILVFE